MILPIAGLQALFASAHACWGKLKHLRIMIVWLSRLQGMHSGILKCLREGIYEARNGSGVDIVNEYLRKRKARVHSSWVSQA